MTSISTIQCSRAHLIYQVIVFLGFIWLFLSHTHFHPTHPGALIIHIITQTHIQTETTSDPKGLGFSILPEDTSSCGLQGVAVIPPTFQQHAAIGLKADTHAAEKRRRSLKVRRCEKVVLAWSGMPGPRRRHCHHNSRGEPPALTLWAAAGASWGRTRTTWWIWPGEISKPRLAQQLCVCAAIIRSMVLVWHLQNCLLSLNYSTLYGCHHSFVWMPVLVLVFVSFPVPHFLLRTDKKQRRQMLISTSSLRKCLLLLSVDYFYKRFHSLFFFFFSFSLWHFKAVFHVGPVQSLSLFFFFFFKATDGQDFRAMKTAHAANLPLINLLYWFGKAE